MEAGRLRKLATYQIPQRSRNPVTNEQQETWIDMAEYRVSIEPLRAAEILKAKSVQENVTHRINMRYTTGITADGRFTYDSRIFDIVGVINIEERNIELQILANEIVKAVP